MKGDSFPIRIKYLLALVAIAWLMRIVFLDATLSNSITSFIGLTIIASFAYLLSRISAKIAVFWDEQKRLMAIVRPWEVEVFAGRLLSSVPLGIDLTHSAKKVLKAIHPQLVAGTNASIRFFVFRNLRDEQTRVGFMVVCRAKCFLNCFRTLRLLSEHVLQLSSTLESALRAAYPHTAVGVADVQLLLQVISGGLPHYA